MYYSSFLFDLSSNSVFVHLLGVMETSEYTRLR